MSTNRRRFLDARWVLPLCCGLFIAFSLPLVLSFGANAEEMVGLLRTPPQRALAEAPPAPSRMFSSDGIPVWGYVDADGDYSPVMIDGHVGGLSFVGARLLNRVAGLSAARLESTLFGALMVALCFFVARELAGPVAGALAAVFAATSAHAAFVYLMVRPDEQLDALLLLAALAALLTHRKRRTSRWLYLAALLTGLSLAAKNTALWALAAAALAMLAFHLIPRLRPRQWVASGLLVALPLLPQLVYVVSRSSSEGNAFSSRLRMISSPIEGLSPSRLAESIVHLVVSVGATGSFLGGYITGLGRDFATPLWPLSALILLGVVVAVGLTFAKTRSVEVRAFGAGLGILLLVYWALYYRGASYYMLLCPWLPIALAFACDYGFARAKTLSPRSSKGLRLAVLALAVAWCFNGVWEIRRLHQAVGDPAPAMFNRAAEEELVRALVAHDARHPIVTTYGMVGVLETLSSGGVVPRYLDREICEAHSQYQDYALGWRALLAELPDGGHDVVLVPNASPLDVNCEDGSQIAGTLRPAILACGGRYETLETVRNRHGLPVLELARVDIPVGCARAPATPELRWRRGGRGPR